MENPLDIDLRYGYGYVLDEEGVYSVLHKTNNSQKAGYFLLKNDETRSYEHTIKYTTMEFRGDSSVFIDPDLNHETRYSKNLFFDFMLPIFKRVYFRGIYSLSWHESIIKLGQEAEFRGLAFFLTRDDYTRGSFLRYDTKFDSRLYESKFGYYIGEDYE